MSSFKQLRNILILTNEKNFKIFVITLIFIVILVSGVYFYAGYLTRTGKAEDADGNFIPDSWEENFGWSSSRFPGYEYPKKPLPSGQDPRF